MKVSAFMLSLVSPVFHKMVCGAFKESFNKHLALEDVSQAAFQRAMDLACGRDGLEVGGLSEVIELAKLADKFQMSSVAAALEDVILKHLSVDVCVEILSACTEENFAAVREAGHRMLLSRFEEIASTESFLSLSEEMLGSILDDDGLIAEKEERIFEAVARWMKGGEKGQACCSRGRNLLKFIRFPLMDAKYLGSKVNGSIPDDGGLHDLVIESLVLKVSSTAELEDVQLHHLGPRARTPRHSRGVAWERYPDKATVRLSGHSGLVFALAECAGRVCSGSGDGSILVWDKASLRAERTMHVDDVDFVAVWSLAVWGKHLISGDTAGRVRVWDIESGRCERVLSGHIGGVRALAVCGTRLLSGSSDNTVRVWGMSTAVEWPCERTLVGHTDVVRSLAAWRDLAMSGSGDKSIRVWDVQTGAQRAVLAGHARAVTALLVISGGRRLLSSGVDGTMRVWSMSTWAPEVTVQAYGLDSVQFGYRLVVSGAQLVSGSAVREDEDATAEGEDEDEDEGGARGGRGGCEVCVWDVETLERRCVLRQTAGAEVRGLLALRGPGGPEVWGAVGDEIVVWGRD